MNLKRAHALHAYTLTEIYELKYRGFLGSRSAGMVVEVAYRAPATKTFTVQSTRGSKMRVNKVLKKLVRAQIWVNVADFAVTRLEAVPAKSPSFWTKHSEIHETYGKVGDFWLPEHNQSTSSIRFGGKAEMTIEYQNYKIASSDPVGSLSH